MNRMNRFLYQTLFGLLLGVVLLMPGGCKDDPKSDSTTQNNQPKQSSGATKSAEPGPTTKNTKSGEPVKQAAPKPIRKAAQPDRVSIRYALVGHKGSVNPVGGDRSPEAARALAELIASRFKAGVTITSLLLELKGTTLGSIGAGDLNFVNFGIPGANPKIKIFPREKQPAVADKAFDLKIGDIEIVSFDAQRNPLGIWVIERTK